MAIQLQLELVADLVTMNQHWGKARDVFTLELGMQQSSGAANDGGECA